MRSITYVLFSLMTVASLGLLACGSDLAQVTAGEVGLSRESLDFPQTQVGRSHNGQFQLRNEGDGDLLVTNIEIIDASPYIMFSSSFMTQMAVSYNWRQAEGGQAWADHPAFALAPRDSIQVDINFSPQDTNLECTGTGGSCGRVAVSTNDRNSGTVYVDIMLNQSAGVIDVDPTVLQFPDIVGGPYEDEFIITNHGSGPLTVRAVNDPNIDGITYQEDSNRPEPFTLQQGEDSKYIVSFTPHSGVEYCGGEFNPDEGCTLGYMLIESDDANGNQVTVTLQVGGISVPDIDVSSTTMEFDAGVGSPDTQTVDVSNEGGAPLNWNLRIDPPDLRDLFTMEVGGTTVQVSGQQMTAIQAGNTETVSVTLTPVDDSVVRAELVITAANDPDESVTRVDIYGGDPAPEMDVEPSQLNFPEVATGTTESLEFIIFNNGRATLNITSGDFTINPGAPDNPEFAVSPALAAQTIAPGGRLPVTVTYSRPESDLAGLDHAIIQILSDALAPNNDFLFNIFADHGEMALPPTGIINVTPDEPYVVGETISLDASASTPPDDGELIANPYSWALAEVPDGSEADLSSDYESTVTLIPDVAGTYKVLLTVTANSEAGQTTQAQVSRNLLVVSE